MEKNEIKVYDGKVFGIEVSEYGLEIGYLDYQALSKIVGGCIYNDTVRSVTMSEDWEIVAGEYSEYISQDYIISKQGFEFLRNYTDEIVFYNEKLDIYVWSVTHYGTAWHYVLTGVKLIREDDYKRAYANLTAAHRNELNAFPVTYAFGDKQLQEALKTLGVDSIEECTTVFGHGDIMRKEDAGKFIEMLECHSKEIKDLIMSDERIAEVAFRYEMDNHEYAINWDGDEEILRCFGLNYEDLAKYDLENAYRKARKAHMDYMMEAGVI